MVIGIRFGEMPKKGQFWADKEEKKLARIIGFDVDGDPVAEDSDGVIFTFNMIQFINGFDYVPGCTEFTKSGFIVEAVPDPVEDVYPKHYVRRKDTLSGEGKMIAYTRMNSATSGTTFHVDGSSFDYQQLSCADLSGSWIEVSEAEAKAKVNKVRKYVRLWVSRRVIDEGGDFQVRCTPMNETYQNWVELKYSPHEFYVENE